MKNFIEQQLWLASWHLLISVLDRERGGQLNKSPCIKRYGRMNANRFVILTKSASSKDNSTFHFKIISACCFSIFKQIFEKAI